MKHLIFAISTVAALEVPAAEAKTKIAGATVETMYAPSGQTMAVVKCSKNPSKCLKAASKVCEGPYQVHDSESHAGGLLADLMPGPVTWYSMSLTCGNSDGRMPSFQFRGQQWNPPAYVHCNSYGGSVLCTGW